MARENASFDVRMRSAPARTPRGAEFTPALARVLGVELWMAEHLARNAPIFVKRAIAFDEAARLCATLEELGARVDRVGTARRGDLLPPRPSAVAPFTPLSLRPTAPPTVRTWAPLPPPARAPRVGTGTALLGAAAAIALAFIGATHWLRSATDAKMLGNTPIEETTSTRHYGLTGAGIEADRRTKLTLIVAWRTGCLRDDYLKFLQDLADAHRRELTVLGAGLAVPDGHDPSARGKLPQPPPDPWPPKECEPGFEVLTVARGHVSDLLTEPATYLYDADGSLIAAWRGGMAPLQRERLTTWLDGRTWDR